MGDCLPPICGPLSTQRSRVGSTVDAQRLTLALVEAQVGSLVDVLPVALLSPAPMARSYAPIPPPPTSSAPSEPLKASK